MLGSWWGWATDGALDTAHLFPVHELHTYHTTECLRPRLDVLYVVCAEADGDRRKTKTGRCRVDWGDALQASKAGCDN